MELRISPQRAQSSQRNAPRQVGLIFSITTFSVRPLCALRPCGFISNHVDYSATNRPHSKKLDGKPLSDAEDEPEGQNPDGNQHNAHQLPVPNSPARQSKSDADQDVDQEEEDQKQVQVGVQVFRLLQRQQDSVVPGVSRNQEDDHEDEEHPGTESVDLEEESASIQFEFTIMGICFARIKISGFMSEPKGLWHPRCSFSAKKY